MWFVNEEKLEGRTANSTLHSDPCRSLVIRVGRRCRSHSAEHAVTLSSRRLHESFHASARRGCLEVAPQWFWGTTKLRNGTWRCHGFIWIHMDSCSFNFWVLWNILETESMPGAVNCRMPDAAQDFVQPVVAFCLFTIGGLHEQRFAGARRLFSSLWLRACLRMRMLHEMLLLEEFLIKFRISCYQLCNCAFLVYKYPM